MNKINTAYFSVIIEQIEDTPRQQIIAKLGECANLLRDVSKIAQKYNLDNVHGGFSISVGELDQDTDGVAATLQANILELHQQENKLAQSGTLTESVCCTEVNPKSIIIRGVVPKQYPEFEDAYISYAELKDGTPLNEYELDEFMKTHPKLVLDLATEEYYNRS